MNFRGLLSFCISTSMVFAQGSPGAPASDETLLRPELDREAVKTHLILAIDEYDAARDAYHQKGTEAFLAELSELTVDDREFLKSKINNLKPLPEITLEEGNWLSAGAHYRAQVISLSESISFKIGEQTLRLNHDAPLHESYERLAKAFDPPKLSFAPSIVREAHASGGFAILAVVAVLVAGFLGGKSFLAYKRDKQDVDNGSLPENASDAQLSQYRQQHHLESDGSRKFGFFNRAGRTFSRFWSKASTKDNNSSKYFYGTNAWGKSIVNGIRRLGPNSRMMTKPPQDMLKQCPRFLSISIEEREKVWTAWIDAISMAESGHNTNDSYPEKFGVVSRGLMQISWRSARGHGGACRGATPKNLHHPLFNLECGVQIMEHQLQKHNSIFTTGKPSHYYWSVLSPKLNPSGVEKVQKRLNYLKTNPERWPTSCQAESAPAT